MEIDKFAAYVTFLKAYTEAKRDACAHCTIKCTVDQRRKCNDIFIEIAKHEVQNCAL